MHDRRLAAHDHANRRVCSTAMHDRRLAAHDHANRRVCSTAMHDRRLAAHDHANRRVCIMVTRDRPATGRLSRRLGRIISHSTRSSASSNADLRQAPHVAPLAPVPARRNGISHLDVRVPNERDDASTTKVEVKFPPGFISVSHEPVAGWNAKVKMAKLDRAGRGVRREAHRARRHRHVHAPRARASRPGRVPGLRAVGRRCPTSPARR